MARQIIDTTTNNGAYIGDAAVLAFNKVNANFSELYSRGPVSPNLLLNPRLLVNQRSFAGGALAAGAYGYDAWKAAAGGCNVTSNGTVITHTSGAIIQVLEGLPLASRQVTFSLDTPSAAVTVSLGGVSGVVSAGAGRQSVVLNLPAGATGDLSLQISTSGATYRDLKLEIGGAVTPFVPSHPSEDLLMCQRWAELISGTEIRGGAFNAVDIMFGVDFKVTKRANPSLTVLSQGSWVGNGGSGTTSTIVLAAPSLSGFRGDVTAFTGSITPGYSYNLRGLSFFADASP